MDQDKSYDVKNDSYEAADSPVRGQSAGLYADILNDPELEGLTLYEKKALLVNRELNSHGMGKYQWWIFFLCGFGYFLDLMWAQAFGLVATPLENELGFPADQYGNIFSAFSAGLTAGAFVWGVLVDIIGRQYAFNLTCLISSVFGLCLGAPSNYDGILVLTAFVGFGVGGNIPIDTTICLEFIPQNRRFLLALLSIFQPLGVVVTSGICYGFIPKYSCGLLPDGTSLPSCNLVSAGTACCTKASNMGWRYSLFTLGGVTLAAFLLRFVVFRFQESPKFLLYRGRDADAVKVLHNIAKFNGQQSDITLEMFNALTEDYALMHGGGSDSPVLGAGEKQAKSSFSSKVKLEFVRYKMLFANFTIARLTVLVWITYVFDYWGFSVAGMSNSHCRAINGDEANYCEGSFLPKILITKGHEINVSVSETYRNYIIIYTPGIVGVLLGACMYAIPIIGRKWGMIISSALMGASLFLFAAVNSEASNIGFNMMEYFFQSMFNAILYGWTPEVFPAPIRGTASGLASFWGRIFGIVSPIIAAYVLAANPAGNGVLYLAGGAVFICTFAILLMPTSRMGAQSY
ncbi:hypothetical protein MMC27_008202 [Xylographa pallens]|nr:hypothetical protein [Xylographa pallens]